MIVITEEEFQIASKYVHDHVKKYTSKWNEQHNTDIYIPNVEEINQACIRGFEKMRDYGRNYGINTDSIDYIKFYAFSIAQIQNCITSKPSFTTIPSWFGLIVSIQLSYKGSFSVLKMKYKKQTCRILETLEKNGLGIASYTYIKGIQETAEACLD